MANSYFLEKVSFEYSCLNFICTQFINANNRTIIKS